MKNSLKTGAKTKFEEAILDMFKDSCRRQDWHQAGVTFRNFPRGMRRAALAWLPKNQHPKILPYLTADLT